MLRVVLALGLSVVLLGGIAGCGGAGEASTTDAKDRVGLDTHKGGASDGTGVLVQREMEFRLLG